MVVLKFYGTFPPIVGTYPIRKIMIKVENLSYTYPKSKETVLKNLNFEIEQGEIFGLGIDRNHREDERRGRSSKACY